MRKSDHRKNIKEDFIGARLTPDQLIAFRAKCDQRGLDVSKVCRNLIAKWLRSDMPIEKFTKMFPEYIDLFS